MHGIRIDGLDALVKVDAAASSSPIPADRIHNMPPPDIGHPLALVHRKSEAANQSHYQQICFQTSKSTVSARLLSLRAEGISPRALPEPWSRISAASLSHRLRTCSESACIPGVEPCQQRSNRNSTASLTNPVNSRYFPFPRFLPCHFVAFSLVALHA